MILNWWVFYSSSVIPSKQLLLSYFKNIYFQNASLITLALLLSWFPFQRGVLLYFLPLCMCTETRHTAASMLKFRAELVSFCKMNEEDIYILNCEERLNTILDSLEKYSLGKTEKASCKPKCSFGVIQCIASKMEREGTMNSWVLWYPV